MVRKPNAKMPTSMPELREIVASSMLDLKHLIEQGFDARGKNATGRTARSIQTTALAGPTFAVGTLSMNEEWKYVGNGRGPGKPPPIPNIQQWINARGLSLSAYAVANNIAKKGSLDFRLKRTNVVLDEVKAWEDTALGKVDVAAQENMVERTVEIFQKRA